MHAYTQCMHAYIDMYIYMHVHACIQAERPEKALGTRISKEAAGSFARTLPAGTYAVPEAMPLRPVGTTTRC